MKEINSSGRSYQEKIELAFTQMKTVFAFSLQFKLIDQFADALTISIKTEIANTVLGGLRYGLSTAFFLCALGLVFWSSVQLIARGDTDADSCLICIVILLCTANASSSLNVGSQKESIDAAQRIFSTIKAGNESSIDGLSPQGLCPTSTIGKIEFKDVSFIYPTRPDIAVCKGYNFVIEAGEVVAFVGLSGSGKSTIVNLLLRFYENTSGSILLDDVDIKALNVRWLRSSIGYVGQEPVLFSGSIRDNILRGSLKSCDFISTKRKTKSPPNIAEENKDIEISNLNDGNDYMHSCKSANAHDFIMDFPEQYDTDIGEGNISGGQKQRIAIARALIKKPSILILDEATSALDAISEHSVQNAIDELQKKHQQTTIIIAHRLVTIKNADKIVVIDKGIVVGIGKHEELLSKNELYRHLWSIQGTI